MQRRIVILSGVLCTLLIYWGTGWQEQEVVSPKSVKQYPLSKNQLAQMTGVSMERNIGDVKCTIAVDKVSLQQKKVGFLSVGGSRELVFTGVNIGIEIPEHAQIPDYNPLLELKKIGEFKEGLSSDRFLSINDIFLKATYGKTQTTVEGKRAILDTKKNVIHIEKGVWKQNNKTCGVGSFTFSPKLSALIEGLG